MNEAEKAVYKKLLQQGQRREAQAFKEWCEERRRKEQGHE